MILKLNPGDRTTFTVERVEEVQGNYGPQVKFIGTTESDSDAAMFLNCEPADRQLERINLTRTSVVGQTIEFEKVEKNGTRYTNLHRVGQTITRPAVAPSNVKQAFTAGPLVPGMDDTPSPATISKLDGLFTLYRVCFNEATSVAMKSGAALTLEGLSAISATLLIAADKRGIAA